METFAADAGWLSLWLVLGALAYLALSAFMALDHREHMLANKHQGVVLALICGVLGAVGLVSVIIVFLFEGPRQEFLHFIGARAEAHQPSHID